MTHAPRSARLLPTRTSARSSREDRSSLPLNPPSPCSYLYELSCAYSMLILHCSFSTMRLAKPFQPV
ncbi:unnamed protein product [Pieris brassicae]|uniref:Uncharacterized protein n=1 Tax=Pieris brassicae TaxID=7116 RepID=A0A9P0TII0_PIEBR|nr:unnamed protein product [Pieris brassicae]